MSTVKIIKERVCIAILFVGISLAGFHEMDESRSVDVQITHHSEQSILILKIK